MTEPEGLIGTIGGSYCINHSHASSFLSNAEARKLLAWLNERYVLDELADISDG